MATVIIGGGLIGLATAQALIERGEDVLVLEANDAVGCETSFANGGMLTPSLPEPWNGPGVFTHLLTSLFVPGAAMKLRLSAIPGLLAWGASFIRHSSRERYYAAVLDNYRLARYSLEKTLDVAERFGLDFDFDDRGTLCTFDDSRAMAARMDLCQRLADAGLTARELGVDEVVELEPALAPARDRLVGGIWLPDDARGDAHRFCGELASAIEKQGGQVRCAARVERLNMQDGRLRSLVIANEELEADRVVVAAGTGSRRLLQTVGLRLPVQPAKGYSITIDGERLGLLPAVTIGDDATHTVINVLGRRLRVAGTAEFAGYDKSLTRSRIDALFRSLRAVLPSIAARVSQDEVSKWTGLRPMSDDGRPFIGPTSVPGIFVNTGHGALGWTMAMGSGQVLADQVLGREPDIDERPYRPARVRA